ncbi:MAG: DUF1599 domain-containing protein [Bacteroidales bacterium]|nr:DUF1599 domain-containing protein [Bacteroidales bacterium]
MSEHPAYPGTSAEFDAVIARCREIFIRKASDYGNSWRVLRPSALTDQIYIKASRIRSIQQKGLSRVDEGIIPEFMGIVNYAIMALIQCEQGASEEDVMQTEESFRLYDKYAMEAKRLMENKNHDYDEAWRNMRISSLNDIILMKLMRIKQIEDHEGKTSVSEGVEANYYDIINYAVFALIGLTSQETSGRKE